MLGLPKSTEMRKQLPKTAIYSKFAMNTAAKEKFDADISRLTIVNEISKATSAIAPGENVSSFYVLLVSLKRKEYSNATIAQISKLINQNMLLILEYDGQAKLAAFHTKLLQTDWANLDTLAVSLNGLGLDAIWENILVQVGNVEIADGNTLAEQIQQDEERLRILKQIEQLAAQARRETNPRKKFDLVQKSKLRKE